MPGIHGILNALCHLRHCLLASPYGTYPVRFAIHRIGIE